MGELLALQIFLTNRSCAGTRRAVKYSALAGRIVIPMSSLLRVALRCFFACSTSVFPSPAAGGTLLSPSDLARVSLEPRWRRARGAGYAQSAEPIDEPIDEPMDEPGRFRRLWPARNDVKPPAGALYKARGMLPVPSRGVKQSLAAPTNHPHNGLRPPTSPETSAFCDNAAMG